MFVDATHVKAHANRNKCQKQLVKREVLAVEIQLQEEINQERARYGKKPFDYDGEGDENEEPSEDSATEVKEMTLSPNDPDCGMFFKGQHQRNFAYNIQTAVDAHGWILGYHVARGNENDSRSFYGLYEKIKRFDIDEMVMDAGYKTPLLMHFLVQEGIVPILPYSRPKTRKKIARCIGRKILYTTRRFIVSYALWIRYSLIPQPTVMGIESIPAILRFAFNVRS